MLVIDEAQRLHRDFFLDYAFDTRDLLTVWLVGLPSLAQRLALREHAALRTRIVSPNVLRPRDRDTFSAMLEHGLRTAGANSKLFSRREEMKRSWFYRDPRRSPEHEVGMMSKNVQRTRSPSA